MFLLNEIERQLCKDHCLLGIQEGSITGLPKHPPTQKELKTMVLSKFNQAQGTTEVIETA